MSKKKKQDEAPAFRTSIGGQALIEGIMMRGPKKQAIVVRNQEGELVRKEEELKLIKERHPILGWVIIRGAVSFIDSMIKGVKALTYSAEFYPDDESAEPSKLDIWLEKHFKSETLEKAIIAFSVIMGIVLAVGLFMILPTLLVGFLGRFTDSGILLNLAEGVVRIVLFLLYLWGVSQMKDIQRVWQYHGAEHKTIHCYERGLDLTVDNVRKMSTRHPRCGTSFLLIVMIVSIIVFCFVKWSSGWIRVLSRIVLVPIIIGVSWEIIKLAGRYDNWLTAIISAPGKALQGLTTREPDDSMMEVAIEALKMVIPEEKGADAW